MLKNQNFFLLLITALPVYNALSFSSVSKGDNVKYFEKHIDFFGNKVQFINFFICLAGIDTDPDPQNLYITGYMHY
jgi:hypothetical protein